MRTPSTKALAVLAGLGSLMLFACRGKSEHPVEGSYATVSESEWTIILSLEAGGRAEILVESWAPGEYESRSAEKTLGRWRREGNMIILDYEGRTDRLAYVPELSLSVLGYEGGAPGLRQSGTFSERSILRDQPLWKLPHRFGPPPRPR